MTAHPKSFDIQKALSAAEVMDRLNLSPEVVAPHKTSKMRWLRRLLLTGASLIALTGAAHFGWDYWTVGRFEISTDDAYVKADNTTIAPKVSGYIAAVLVGDNEPVKAGQVLARIDNRDYGVALDQAKADVAAAKAAVSNKQAALDAQQSVIEAARATLGVDQANQTFAEQDDKRYAHLATTGYGSVQNAQQAASRIAAAKASVARDQASLVTALKQVDVLKAELAQAKASSCPQRGGAKPGRAEPILYGHRFAGRWRRGQPDAARWPIRPSRNSTDVDRTRCPGLYRC